MPSAGKRGSSTLPSGTTTNTNAPSETSAIRTLAQSAGSVVSDHSPTGIDTKAMAVSGTADRSASRLIRPISVNPIRNSDTMPTSTAAGGSMASCRTGTSTTDRPKPARPRTKPAARAVSAAIKTASMAKPKIGALLFSLQDRAASRPRKASQSPRPARESSAPFRPACASPPCPLLPRAFRPRADAEPWPANVRGPYS